MLLECLKGIEDHRDPQGREFQLWEILLVCILAILSGKKTYTDIERFANVHLASLRKYFGIKWKRVLHFSAIRKVLIQIDPEALRIALNKWSSSLCGDEKSCLNFDGKALSGSFSHVKDQRAAYVFQVFEPFKGLVLDSVLIGEKKNEIEYFQQMIKELDLKDVYITADAMHCQKKHLN